MDCRTANKGLVWRYEVEEWTPVGKWKYSAQGTNNLVVTQKWTQRIITQGRMCYNKTTNIA